MFLCSHCPWYVPVCFTRPHGMFLVLYVVTNHMGGFLPPRCAKLVHIHIFIHDPDDFPLAWSYSLRGLALLVQAPATKPDGSEEWAPKDPQGVVRPWFR